MIGGESGMTGGKSGETGDDWDNVHWRGEENRDDWRGEQG